MDTIDVIDWHIEQAAECKDVNDRDAMKFHLKMAQTLIEERQSD